MTEFYKYAEEGCIVYLYKGKEDVMSITVWDSGNMDIGICELEDHYFKEEEKIEPYEALTIYAKFEERANALVNTYGKNIMKSVTNL